MLDKRRLSLLEGVCLRLGLLLTEWLVCKTPLIRDRGVSPSISLIAAKKPKLRVYFSLKTIHFSLFTSFYLETF